MRIRLTLWVVAIFTLIHWTTSGLLWLYQSNAIEQLADERLIEHADKLVRRVADMLPGVDRALLDEIAREQIQYIRFESFGIDVLRRDGTSATRDRQTLFDASEISAPEVLASGRPVFYRADASVLSHPGFAAQGKARVVAMSILGGDLEPYVLVVGTSDDFTRSQLALVGRIFIVSALLGPLVASVSGWFIAGIAVAPFERLGRMAAQMRPESLHETLDLPVYNKEIAELRDQLNDARQRLRGAFGMQERFLTNVSHELKTPIAVILAEAQTLNLEKLPKDAQDFVRSTREEMRHLGKLIESLLGLARLREGTAHARMSRVTLNDLAVDTVDGCLLMARQDGVKLVPELASDEAGLDAEIYGEPQLLRTMLENLVRNAIRFTPKGGRVTMRVTVEEGRGVLSVTDEGPGIPESEIGSLFERFKQGTNQRPAQAGRDAGHGLGLSIAQGIAELHGGRIRANNLEVGGCVFRVCLPLAGQPVAKKPVPKGVSVRYGHNMS
ncbi:MAG: HAMP domain-containing histidine kinase [Phycisphaerales bacterium]|nr:HAMP domain-containing histidine kinase [Phycisphaerales bacterium]